MSSGRYNGNPTPFEGQHSTNPTQGGWTYTGCNEASRVEFYEKGGAKMDYYPTTGTVKTSMEHSSKGSTQLFRRGLTDAEFTSVVDNPRQHTGKGYYTKK